MPDGSFLAKPLAALGAIYRFVGGLSGASRVELASPIQLVHDVSSESEHGATLLFGLTHSQTTGGAGAPARTVVDVADFFSGAIGGIAGSLASLGRTPQNTDVYLMAIEAKSSGVNLSRAVAGLIPPNVLRYPSSIGITQGLLLLAGDTVDIRWVPGVGGLRTVTNTDPAGTERHARELSDVSLPARIQTLQIMAVDDAVGATTVTWVDIWAFVPVNGEVPRA